MCNTSTLLRLIIIILTQNYSACNHFINRYSFQCVLKHCFKRYYLVRFFAIFLLTSSQLMFIIFHSHKIFLKITPSIGQIFFRKGHLTQLTQDDRESSFFRSNPYNCLSWMCFRSQSLPYLILLLCPDISIILFHEATFFVIWSKYFSMD